MKVLLEIGEYCQSYNNALAICNAFTFYGDDVTLFNPNNHSIIDAVEDNKPDLLIHSGAIGENAKFILNKNNVKTFNRYQLVDILVDPLVYKKQEPSNYFKCDKVIFMPYAFEKIDMAAKYLAPDKNEIVRIFSPNPQPGGKYCGWLNSNMHALLLCSASSVITCSEYTAANAILCNSNVYIGNDKYTCDTKDLIKNKSTLRFILDNFINDEEHQRKFEEFLNA